VRSADVRILPAELSVVGISAAGTRYGKRVAHGQAVRVFTGAPLPDGADTIVVQEDTERVDKRLTVRAAPSAGKHIRPRGQDFAEGDVLLTKGTRLSARSLMLAAAMNHATVPVRRSPQVALLATGDELVPPGHDLGSDEIVSSVRYGLAAMIAAHGGVPLDLGIAKDDAKSIATLASSGAGADILVTVGGASVGDRDLVVSTLEAQGLKLDFAKVAMRPGKPAFYGHMGAQRVFGVPGNPVSALICAQVFLLPMLSAMLALRDPIATPSEAVADVDLEANGPRQYYMRAITRRRDDGAYLVRPLPSQDSSLMAALVRADCLIVRRPHAPPLPASARVHILPFAS